MGKGDKYRPVDRNKWDDGYDRIFDNSKKEKGRFIWDKKQGRFIPESEFIKEPKDHVGPHFHIVGGTEASRYSERKKHIKNLQKDPLYTTLPEKKKEVQDFKDRKNETQAQLRQKLDPKVRKKFDKHILDK